MSSKSVSSLCSDNVGITKGDSYRIAWQELAWLLSHANSTAEARLDLLKSLQIALPSQDSGDIANLKELLSNLIIMQSRLADREEELDGALSLQSGNPPVSHVALNQDTISSVGTEILSAAQRIRSKV